MKLNVGDLVTINIKDKCQLTVKVEDASKGDMIQGKVETTSDEAANKAATFVYEVGKVYSFSRNDIVNKA